MQRPVARVACFLFSPRVIPRALSRPGVLFAVLAAASAWLCAALPIFSQEAYYWTYAQHPALSYFDHPPMVAWLIWLGTQALGDGALGVRAGTWLCGLAATWLGVLLLRDFGIDRRGQATWILLALMSPIVTMTHFLANPDAPLVAAWTLTMWAIWRARGGGLGWWLLAGLGAGLALTSKYSAAFLGVGGVLLLLADAPLRRQLLRPGPWLALAVASLVFLPVVWWNVQNDFESFRFQTTERLHKGHFGFWWFTQFVGGQVLVLHPLLALALPIGLGFLLRRLRTDARALHLLAFGVPMLGYLLFQSLWIQVKLNWMAPAYVALLLTVVWWWRERGGTASLRHPAWRWALASFVLVPIVVVLSPALRLIPPGSGTSWTGWDEIAEHAEKWEERLDRKDSIDGNVFFFAADYRDAAQLGRSLRLMWEHDDHHDGSPADPGEPTLAQNVLGQRALQFEHWTSPRACVGQDAVFVLPRPRGREAMVKLAAERFAHIELAEHLQVECWGIDLLDADIYTCRGYKGPDVKQ
ncbi:MAG: glycosyltransferase family 39 protein [Planctomycetes bacterium]|nr:glycosyltransferase family 39 protein [Planctomycetota bacterium]MCC7398543.1 glycosyltransferase family 39 protein [Planctomycetota bacterium]